VSDREQKIFYGDEGRVPLVTLLMNLYQLTGSEECAKELAEAADEVERSCAGAALTAMPGWVQ
jgi:hypothetical protein